MFFGDDNAGEMFQDFMKFMEQRKKKHPTSQNPEKYARSQKLGKEDSKAQDLLFMLTEMNMKHKEVSAQIDTLKILYNEAEALRGKFFKKAQAQYPELFASKRGGEAWREWKGDYYLVSWDGSSDDDEED